MTAGAGEVTRPETVPWLTSLPTAETLPVTVPCSPSSSVPFEWTLPVTVPRSPTVSLAPARRP